MNLDTERAPLILKFFSVGVVSTLVDWASYWVLIKFIEYHWALGISMIIGAVVNFLMNRSMTFDVRDRVFKRFMIFFGIFGIMVLASQLIITGLVYVIHDKMIARIITTVIIFVCNYFLHKKITFR
jgi:putative flippase GtrA